jgi:hypothetical protein
MNYKKQNWNIKRKGRKISVAELEEKLADGPEKMELIDGKLYWAENERMTMLGLLIENFGIDKALKFGDLKLWKEAISEIENKLKGK